MFFLIGQALGELSTDGWPLYTTAVSADVGPAELAGTVILTATVKDGVDPARVDPAQAR